MRGLPVRPVVRLADLLKAARPNQIAIVLYDGARGEGHVSPLLGQRRGRVVLPYDDDGWLDQRTFNRRWRAPESLRQCVIVTSRS
jgi:hypothetical protein